MIKIVKFENEKAYIEDFLKLPGILYDKKTIMQNKAEEESLLNGTHPLSRYFKLHKYIVYKGGETAGRFIITTYDDDDTIYLGFFECIKDRSTAEAIFNEVKEFAQKGGYRKIRGPVDASFWIKYRLKINMFDKVPYTGEPYNKDYYYEMFLENGFDVCKKYSSNSYKQIPLIKTGMNEFKKRHEQFKNKGYTFEIPSKKTFDRCFRDIYKLIIDLYSDFPVYKHIDEEDFINQFKFFKDIIDFSFIRLVYYNEKPVAFLIGIPDYRNELYRNLTICDYIKILFKRSIRSSNYVMLYLGVDSNHKGLARAVTYEIIENLKKKRSKCIGALIKDGNINANYAKDKLEDKYEYVLLEYELDSNEEIFN